MLTSAPTLETERLVLRAHTAEDFPAYAAMWADADVNRFIGGKPLTEEEAWMKYMRVFGQWPLIGYGYWSVHEKTTGERLGETGFFEARRNITPPFIGIPEAGWAFAKAAHGKGYASEAVKAIHAWGDTYFNKARTVCIISPENTASLNVAAKLGYVAAHTSTYHNDPILILYRDP
ncbi:MAG TPA: GNAT family N-acetyltransferase [Rhizomicrobium sp.]|jgi:RimJ/RimL family protein N-acetyltransferase|nr:GNAT family N-acetyltransferase [Rhizomicrobium sp.]